MLEADADGEQVRLEPQSDSRAVVVLASGDLDYETASVLDAALARAAEVADAVVVDLSAVDFADSTILHILTRARTRAETGSRALFLAGPLNDTLERLFEVTGLGDAFRFSPDRESALAAVPRKWQ
ncbi:STAS domain-containing protein [Actinacidiphila alni]|uniref:Anti-sigma B factor antagonist n=1 Tax=Actinacidiphila alni TaxID=380248 RepID=A0A1I2LJD7_9ACTN|nr:STAS domain-containing protein [Actinacidiphila alni]SFF79385.1 anti-sigma B factor antagonist [Actinacidiphila alni]